MSSGKARKNNKDAQLPRVRCTSKELERWMAAARHDGRSLSSWVRRILNIATRRKEDSNGGQG